MTAQQDFEHVGADLADLGVTISKMFGKPAYKNAGGKAIACLFQEGLACRLVAGTAEHTEALSLPGAVLFHPSGDAGRSPMKDWVVVPHANVGRWRDYAEAALERLR
jgi:hypothetical protein